MRAFFDPGVQCLNWSELRARRALPCVVSLVAILAAGIVFGHQVNYALYALYLPSYIVFLLDFGGLSPAGVVVHRTLNTALGGVLAMLSYVTVPRRHRSPQGDPPTVSR